MAYLSQCFADNSYVTVQLSVLLTHEFLSVQVYFLSQNVYCTQCTASCYGIMALFYLVVDRIDVKRRLESSMKHYVVILPYETTRRRQHFSNICSIS